MAAPSAIIRRPPKKEEVAAASGLAGLWTGLSSRVTELSRRGSTLVTRVTPYVSWGADLVWAVGSGVLILSLPLLVEIQREETVRVMQHQRERELHDLAEQSRMASGGLMEQMVGITRVLAGSGDGEGK